MSVCIKFRDVDVRSDAFDEISGDDFECRLKE